MAVKAKTPSKPAASNGHQLSESALDRGRVSEIQRARMLAAMAQEIAVRGAPKVSVAHVVARSGVSRRTFYEIFEDREDCFLAAFDDALTHVAAVVIPAYEPPGSWQARIRAALTALLEHLDYDPAMGRLLIVESLAAGPKALERRQRVLARIISVLEEGRGESKTGSGLPPLTAEGIAGGVLSVLHARFTETMLHPVARSAGAARLTDDSLLELLNPLMGMIVMPYLGPAAARREIERPTRKHSGKRSVVRTDPLQDLPMRFTYRTMRVLMAVAEHPGSSNRSVGQGAGIGDQGQASKLLARLCKLGLVENQGGDPARGVPNAWMLTTTGQRVHETITGLETHIP